MHGGGIEGEDKDEDEDEQAQTAGGGGTRGRKKRVSESGWRDLYVDVPGRGRGKSAMP